MEKHGGEYRSKGKCCGYYMETGLVITGCDMAGSNYYFNLVITSSP